MTILPLPLSTNLPPNKTTFNYLSPPTSSIPLTLIMPSFASSLTTCSAPPTAITSATTYSSQAMTKLSSATVMFYLARRCYASWFGKVDERLHDTELDEHGAVERVERDAEQCLEGILAHMGCLAR